MITIVSASLNPDSKSRILAQETQRILQEDGQEVALVDLRDFALPLCDGDSSYSHAEVERIRGPLHAGDAIIVATPIYNYAANAAVKNLIELTGDLWENKVVGFLCAAGGMNSYMSIVSLANSLMLDFRSIIVPRFVYATSDAFAGGRIKDAEIARRVADLARTTARLSRALAVAA
jgi:NAD(P)H-dependent FMN reductase